jgi:hypothetical protein
MALATSNRAQLRFIKETVFGTIPVAGNPNNLRMTGESLAFAIQSDTSKEIRSDRQVTDLIQTGANASGDINIELSYAEFDPLLEAVMQSVYTVFGVNGVGAAVPTSATFAAGTLTAGSATSGASIFTNLVKGQWVKIAGSSIAGQNIWAQVSTTVDPTATVLTFQGTPFTGVTGSGGAAVTVSASRLVNGTTLNSYTIERAIADSTVPQFFAYRGMSASKLSLKFAAGSVVGGAFSFMGKDANRVDTTTQLPGTPIASKTYDVMNAVAGVGNIMEGGAVLTGTYIKSVDLSIDNSLRAQTAIGTLGAIGIGTGTLQVSGTMEVYLADGTMWDKFRNNTASSMSLRATDGAGNGYAITLPKIKYGDAKVNAGSLDQDIMLSMPFTAIMDPTSLKTIIIDRAGAAVT